MVAQVCARFMNDTNGELTLLWHRPMEGGLRVAQEISKVASGRARIVRTFEGHEFSVWDGDDEVQHWVMQAPRRQNYHASSANIWQAERETRPPPVPPRPNSAQRTDGEADAILAQARTLASERKYNESLQLFKRAQQVIGPTAIKERPKLIARIELLEKLASSGAKKTAQRCQTCTLPKPCGKVHRPAKRTYAEVAALNLPGSKSSPSPLDAAPSAHLEPPKSRTAAQSWRDRSARITGNAPRESVEPPWRRRRLTHQQLHDVIERAKAVSGPPLVNGTMSGMSDAAFLKGFSSLPERPMRTQRDTMRNDLKAQRAASSMPGMHSSSLGVSVPGVATRRSAYSIG